ncbi:HTH_Tnp_Tc3_2 domain-containing protein [Trichonephila clavipes]|nr:HTH_Tnp_Tc3_2 domain-containing protein [Trichonephila clavipes]
MQVTVRFGSIPPQFRGRTLWGWSEVSHLSSPSTILTRGLAARRLFRVPPCHAGTIHLHTSMSSPGFEPNPYGTAVSVANHYIGWATLNVSQCTADVAGQVYRSECAVRNCWEQWTREGTHARKTGFGATRKTTRREDRRIVRQTLVDPTVTRSTIRTDVGVAIVSQTISRHLAEANLKSKHPFLALPVTPEHRQLRLQWCQARSMWNVTE